MISQLIALSIRFRVLVILAAGLVALAGVYALYHTPIDAIPDLSENQVIVFTPWPGHSPHEIDDQISYPLSLALQGVDGVRVVRASSDVDYSMISLIFNEDITPAAARQRVAERLSGLAVSLPQGVSPVLGPDAAATGQIFWYTVEGEGQDLGRLRMLQDWYIRPQLSSVPGVAEVASVGGYPVEYQVEVDPLRLRAYRASISDVVHAIGQSNSSVGGHVLQKPNAEYLVRGIGWLGAGKDGSADFDPQQVLRDLENVVVPLADGKAVRLGDLGQASLAAGPRRGVLEKDGSETTGGVVLMRIGENPLEVTRRLLDKIQELQSGLPHGVRIVPFYDRTALIEGAVRTVSGTLLEAIVTATLCVLLILRHFRTSLVIAVTLPLATLTAFLCLWLLRQLGWADVQTNIMSLAGIAISIGVLVDASIVMAENVMHTLKNHFGDEPVRGDVRPLVLAACQTVGRPIFFSVVIMLISFLPVFALGGLEGKMFRPLAFTKSFALAAAALLAITLVPALCTFLVRGRLRREEESWVVRAGIDVYRPILRSLLDRPGILAWIVGVTFLVGLAPVGSASLYRGVLLGALVATACCVPRWPMRMAAVASLVVIGLAAQQWMTPLEREFLTPLDEGMVMDMPITIPRASIAQAADDLKARDMVFCRFPEIHMVVGKAGRAETATDPAPLDMIETMIDFRPRAFWPRRKLQPADAERQASAILQALIDRRLVLAPEDRAGLVHDSTVAVMPLFDAQIREYAHQRQREFQDDLKNKLLLTVVETTVDLVRQAGLLTADPTSFPLVDIVAGALPTTHAGHLSMDPSLADVTLLVQATVKILQERGWTAPQADLLRYRPAWWQRPIVALHVALGGRSPNFFTRVHDAVRADFRRDWQTHVDQVDTELRERGAAVFTRLLLEDLLDRLSILDPKVTAYQQQVRQARRQPGVAAGHVHGHEGRHSSLTVGVAPNPDLNAIQNEQTQAFARGLILWKKDRADLIGFGGELDRAMQMPGWTNVWTLPIQNRVDMLTTGVNTTVGVRVLGRKLQDVVNASGAIAAALKGVPGAADVIADPVRGKGYLEMRVDRDKAARYGVTVHDVNLWVETALGGNPATVVTAGRARQPVRVRLPRSWREDESTLRQLPVPSRLPAPGYVALQQVADIRIVEGPAAIKSENGLLRNYVRLNVRGRDEAEFVEEARQVVASRISLPPGVFVEWTGQFEHLAHARSTLTVVVPLAIGLIFLLLYWTYRDAADALLMLLAVPGALAGGVLFQWLFGFKFSVTVWVGYIACFGMATSTGIIMLVYLREAVAQGGGLEKMSLQQLREAVLRGAVQRLRPKLLTEATTVIGLAPLLWADGVGAEVIRPMAAPVLGGILIADEVIDLLLPVLFYHVRRWRWQRLQTH